MGDVLFLLAEREPFLKPVTFTGGQTGSGTRTHDLGSWLVRSTV